MAGAGAKKRLEENKKRLQTLRIAIAVGLVVYTLVRLVWRQGYTSTWHMVGFGATGILEAFAYSAIARFAEPEYNAQGEVVYGGADLSMGGMCAYWHDLLYISVFLQVSTPLSVYFWWVSMVVPGFALYMLYKHVLKPYWSAPREQVLDEATRKKLERTQQRAERRKMKWR